MERRPLHVVQKSADDLARRRQFAARNRRRESARQDRVRLEAAPVVDAVRQQLRRGNKPRADVKYSAADGRVDTTTICGNAAVDTSRDYRVSVQLSSRAGEETHGSAVDLPSGFRART